MNCLKNELEFNINLNFQKNENDRIILVFVD